MLKEGVHFPLILDGEITSLGTMVRFFGNMKAVVPRLPLEIMVPLLLLPWCIQNLWASNWHI